MSVQFTKLYRPKGFKGVVGQSGAKDVLRGILKSGKISPVLLMYGEYGTGKTTLARIYAKHACCLNYDAENLKPCGVCASCKGFDEGNSVEHHPSIEEINSSDSTGVDDIRSLISSAQQRPYGAKYRVFIMDEVHRLSKAAQNAFLKILEEPPETTIFILCTTDPNDLLPTIRSRCTRKLEFRKVSPEDIADYLGHICAAEKVDIPKELLVKIGVSCEGHVRDAVGMLEDVVSRINAGESAESADLVSLVDEVIADSPFKVAAPFLNGIYKGKAIASLGSVQNLDQKGMYLLSVKCLPQMHTEAIYAALSYDKLAMRDRSSAFKYRDVCDCVRDLTEGMDKPAKRDFMESMAAMAKDLEDLVSKAGNFAGGYDLKSCIATLALNNVLRFKNVGKV